MTAILTHRVEGDGPTVLLLNGGMMSIAAWDDVAATLVHEWRVVRCDFRGQLLTPELPPHDLGGHVDDLAALLDRLGLERVHVAGTSFGGEVGLLLAARHPARVHSLAVAAVVDRTPPGMRAVGEQWIALCERAIAEGDGRPFFAAMNEVVYSAEFRTRFAGALAARYQALASLPASWFAGGIRLLEAIDALDLSGELPRISCPVLVVAAELDALMPRERTAAVVGAIRGAELAIVPDSGHALVVEKKDAFLELLTGFLRRSTVAGGSVLGCP